MGDFGETSVDWERDFGEASVDFERDFGETSVDLERDFGETPVDSNFRPVEADSLQKKIALAGSERSAHEATLYTYRPGEARSRQSQAMRDELKNKIQALAESERSAHPETRQAMREMLKKLHNIMALAERQHSERVR